MTHEAADVELIDMEGKRVFLTDGEVVPITDCFDADGDECDPDEAVAVVAGRDGYGWLTISIDERVTVH